MKNKLMEIASEELRGIDGLNLLLRTGIDEIIECLYDEDDMMDEFEFEQSILYYMNCENANERKKVEVAAQKMFPYYKK